MHKNKIYMRKKNNYVRRKDFEESALNYTVVYKSTKPYIKK